MSPLIFRARASDTSDTYWRSLHYYNLYRLIVSGVFVESFVTFGASPIFGTEDPALFFLASTLYAFLCVISIVTISFRWPAFRFQLGFQIVSDIVVLVLVMYASGGVTSGLGLLLVASLAAVSLIGRGKMVLFYAALAAIAVLLEQFYRIVSFDEGTSTLFQAGLLSISYFATALLARTLATHAAASEELAQQRGVDLANLAQVNQLVIQDMQDGVLVVDQDGKIRQNNSQAEKMLGIAINKSLDLSLGEYFPPLAERFRNWREDRAVSTDPLRVKATGKQIRARFVPVSDERATGALIFLEDMSVAQAQAQQIKLVALGRLTANIAHEIRNPLSAIGHATQLLQEDEGLDKTQARLLEIIRNNTFRLDRLVQDVLHLNRRDRVEMVSIAPAIFLHHFVDEFCQIEKIPPATFSIEIETQLPLCFDRIHLHQVLWNLCRNAWRHCKQQERSIRLCVSEAHMENVVQLDVIDDGPGVDAAIQPRLFEPFSTTESQGTGLGLYIAKEICEANAAVLDYIEVSPGGQFRICCKGGVC